MTLNELMEQSHQTAKEKGWWDTGRNFPEQLMLMVSELSEVLEEYRIFGLEQPFYWEENIKPMGIAVEFADVLIRLADTCTAYNIPLEDALKAKLEYNKTRSYKHGNKKA